MWCPCMINGHRELDSRSGKDYFSYQCFCDERDVFITFSGVISNRPRTVSNQLYLSKVVGKLPIRQMYPK